MDNIYKVVIALLATALIILLYALITHQNKEVLSMDNSDHFSNKETSRIYFLFRPRSYWTNQYLTSSMEKSDVDQHILKSKLVQANADIAQSVNVKYGNAVSTSIANYLNQHTAILMRLTTALKTNDSKNVILAMEEFEKNAKLTAYTLNTADYNAFPYENTYQLLTKYNDLLVSYAKALNTEKWRDVASLSEVFLKFA